MARFGKGDKVQCTESTRYVNIGQIGTVTSDDSDYPFVRLENGERWAISEEKLKPYTDPASEIAQIIKDSTTRSSVFERSLKFIEPIPIDRFEFRYVDEYGRELSHKFSQSEGDYDLCDVIASFRLFILGIGWDREDVDKYIREDRL